MVEGDISAKCTYLRGVQALLVLQLRQATVIRTKGQGSNANLTFETKESDLFSRTSDPAAQGTIFCYTSLIKTAPLKLQKKISVM